MALEFMHFHARLDRFLLGQHHYSSEVIAEAEQALYRFVERTAHIKNLGDFFRGDQMVFELPTKRWVLIDLVDTNNELVPIFSRSEKGSLHPLGAKNTSGLRSEVRALKNESDRLASERIFAKIDEIIQRKTESVWIRGFNFCSQALLKRRR